MIILLTVISIWGVEVAGCDLILTRLRIDVFIENTIPPQGSVIFLPLSFIMFSFNAMVNYVQGVQLHMWICRWFHYV